jgi:GNAT superfamily N-acetyltransferase
MGEDVHMPDGAVSSSELDVVRLGLADIPDCIDIVRRSFDHFDGDAQAARNWFDARILHNPWQPALDGIGVGARARGKLVAFRAMFAQPWWIEGRSTVIAFAAHTCIEPTYRGGGLGGQLIAASRDFAALTGSTSAGNITQRVYRKQGFVAVGGQGNDFFRLRTSYVGSLQSRLGKVLGRAVGGAADALANGAEHQLGGARGYRLRAVTNCTEEFDEFWLRARSGYASCLDRSARYLNWRVFDQPTYALALAALRDGQDRLRGYGVWHVLRYSPHVTCAVLRDLFVAHADDEALRVLLFLLIRHWRREGVTWANLELASHRLTPLFTSLGYEPIPSIGNRYHVYSRQGLNQTTVDGWFRSGLDGDYFDTRPSQHQVTAGREA